MRPTLLMAVALLAASCSGDSGAAPSPSSTSTTTTSTTTTSTTTTSTTTTSTTSTTTTTSTTITTTVPESACGGSGALPELAENHSLAGGDVNGDGDIDTIHTYSIGDPSLAGAWWLQVSFANGGGASQQLLDPGTSLAGARPFDGFDINGNGKDEFFARVGAGASTSEFGLFEVVDCTIHRIALDGQPSVFTAGASVNFVSGFECVDIDANGANDFLIVYTGSRLGETDEFEITAAQYFVLDGMVTFMLADGIGGNINDPDFAKFASAGCPGVTL